MSYRSVIKFQFDRKWKKENGFFRDEDLPNNRIKIKVPVQTLSISSFFSTFKAFLLSVGFKEEEIVKGALLFLGNSKRVEELLKTYGLDIKGNEDSKIWEQRFKELKKSYEKLLVEKEYLEGFSLGGK
jgi:hypothetical protein